MEKFRRINLISAGRRRRTTAASELHDGRAVYCAFKVDLRPTDAGDVKHPVLSSALDGYLLNPISMT